MDVIIILYSILNTIAYLFVFDSILLYYVFVCNLTAMSLFVTSLQCKWPFSHFAFK